jgi:hypothetical protein
MSGLLGSSGMRIYTNHCSPANDCCCCWSDSHPPDAHLLEVLGGRGLVDQLVHLALHQER